MGERLYVRGGRDDPGRWPRCPPDLPCSSASLSTTVRSPSSPPASRPTRRPTSRGAPTPASTAPTARLLAPGAGRDTLTRATVRAYRDALEHTGVPTTSLRNPTVGVSRRLRAAAARRRDTTPSPKRAGGSSACSTRPSVWARSSARTPAARRAGAAVRRPSAGSRRAAWASWPVNAVHCSTSASRSGMSIRGVSRSSSERSRNAAGDSSSASGGDSCRRPATSRTPSPASIAACRLGRACCWSACSSARRSSAFSVRPNVTVSSWRSVCQRSAGMRKPAGSA